MRAEVTAPPPEPGPALPRATAAQRFHIVLPATLLAVRQTVQDAAAHAARATSDPDLPATLELVLAEVMTNIVEHAQAGRDNGIIEFILSVDTDGLGVVLRDDGVAMPGERLPETRCCGPAGAALMDLPEGGFGWPLIHMLCHGVSYQRTGNWNETRLRVPLAPGPQTPRSRN